MIPSAQTWFHSQNPLSINRVFSPFNLLFFNIITSTTESPWIHFMGRKKINVRAGKKSLFIQQKSLPFSNIKRYRICVIYSLLFVFVCLLLVKALLESFSMFFHRTIQTKFTTKAFSPNDFLFCRLSKPHHFLEFPSFQYPANSDRFSCAEISPVFLL